MPGCETGPVALKAHGLAEALTARGLPVEWAVDPDELYAQPDGAAAHQKLPPLGDPTRRDLVLRHCTRLRDDVADTLRAGNIPVTVGGDHAMAAGSIAGLAQAKNAHGRIGVLWIDAHADLNTPATSPSQALHGMPVAALLGKGETSFAALGGGDQPVLRPEHIFYMGLRDVDEGEVTAMELMGINHMSARAVMDMGYEKALALALDKISEGTDYLFLSLDLDVFDPTIAPAVGTPVADGFRRTDFLPALADIIAGNTFAAFEIAEFNPTLPGADETYDLLLQCLTFMLAARQPAAESA
ncbi:MAG: arginase [Alphaproteobacteria bacterium]|nr:arginase [Alphaproteobacteria bacterium]